MTNLPGFLFAGGIPWELFFQSQPINDDRLLAAVFADAFRAVPVTKAAVFHTTHGRIGNNKVDQAIIDANRSTLHAFGQLPTGSLIS